MRAIVALIVLGITGAVCSPSLAAQRNADSGRALPVTAAEFERLGREVRTVLLASPEKFTDERYGTFAELQAARGDLDGARETARQGPQWYAFARVAIAQYQAGDLDGAIATTRMAATFTDRAQALGYLSSAMPFNEGLVLAHTIEWPKQLVEELKRASRDVFHTDTARSMTLLREAIGVAQHDTSFWGGYFDVELAYDQAERGDLAEALRIMVDTLAPGERAERLGRIASALQRARIPRAQALSDSLFGEALHAADQVPDSARRVERRTRVMWLRTVNAGIMSQLAPGRNADGLDSTDLRGISELEARGQFRPAANALVASISQPFLGGLRPERVWPEPATLDSFARRAVEDARRVTPGFTDSTRLRLVPMMLRSAPATPRDLAEAIVDSTVRSRGMLILARRMLDSNLASALGYASAIPVRVARDSLFALAATRTFDLHPDSAIALAHRLGTPSLRATTLLDLAGRAATRGQTSLARTLAVEGLSGIDPLVQPVESTRLVPLVRGGLYDVVVQWARRQSAPEARARVFFALFEAVAAR